MAEQRAVNLLWSCANALTSETHTERLLKSYYINTCRKLARHKAQLPDDNFGIARICSRCGNPWSDGNYQLQLRPQKLADNARRRKLIAKLDKAKQSKDGASVLNRAQRKRAKWLKKRMGSQMKIDCAVCKHKTLLPLEKPKKRVKGEITTAIKTPAISLPTAVTKKKKKPKHKDTNAGLKIPAKSATPTKKATNANKTPKKKTKAAPPAAIAPKTQSKTQKQNALLQLAAMLKSQASKDASKSQQNRLEAFLK